MSAATGVKVPTIRYYEEIGLLPKAERSAGNQRLYGTKAQERLAFIRHARELGFPLDDIRELLSLSDRPDMSCAAADVITRLQALQQEAPFRTARSSRFSAITITVCTRIMGESDRHRVNISFGEAGEKRAR